MVSVLNPLFTEKGNIIAGCQWLDTLRLRIHKKIVQPNAKVIKNRGGNVTATNKEITKLIQTTRKALSKWTSLDQGSPYCYTVATLLVEDALKQGLTKNQFLDWIKPIEKLPLKQARSIIQASLTKLGLTLPE